MVCKKQLILLFFLFLQPCFPWCERLDYPDCRSLNGPVVVLVFSLALYSLLLLLIHNVLQGFNEVTQGLQSDILGKDLFLQLGDKEYSFSFISGPT